MHRPSERARALSHCATPFRTSLAQLCPSQVESDVFMYLAILARATSPLRPCFRASVGRILPLPHGKSDPVPGWHLVGEDHHVRASASTAGATQTPKPTLFASRHPQPPTAHGAPLTAPPCRSQALWLGRSQHLRHLDRCGRHRRLDRRLASPPSPLSPPPPPPPALRSGLGPTTLRCGPHLLAPSPPASPPPPPPSPPPPESPPSPAPLPSPPPSPPSPPPFPAAFTSTAAVASATTSTSAAACPPHPTAVISPAASAAVASRPPPSSPPRSSPPVRRNRHRVWVALLHVSVCRSATGKPN